MNKKQEPSETQTLPWDLPRFRNWVSIARAHNIAVSSLPNYKFPGDVPASDRYWKVDLTTPAVVIDKQAMIQVPEKPGIGFEPIPELLEKYTYEKKEILR